MNLPYRIDTYYVEPGINPGAFICRACGVEGSKQGWVLEVPQNLQEVSRFCLPCWDIRTGEMVRSWLRRAKGREALGINLLSREEAKCG